MVTLDQLVTRALDDNNLNGKWELAREAIEPIVLATIHGLGFHVADQTREVCDPRPKAVDFQYQPHAPRQRAGKRR
jgi:hypothetical protein